MKENDASEMENEQDLPQLIIFRGLTGHGNKRGTAGALSPRKTRQLEFTTQIWEIR